MLYHYTGQAGLEGIMRSQSVWASDATFLNDSTELLYANEVVLGAALREAVGGAQRKDGEGLTASPSVLTFSERGQKTLLTTYSQLFTIYVVCFCEKGDLLSQWRGYGSEAGAFSVGFDTRYAEHLPPWAGNLRRVIYEPDEQRELLGSVVLPVTKALRAAEDEFGPEHVIELLVPECLGQLRDLIWECAFCFKHPTFREENEWRLVYIRDDRGMGGAPTVPRLVRRGPHGFIPYVDLDLRSQAGRYMGRLPIKQIVAGPSSHPQLAMRGVHALLDCHDCGFQTEIVGSEVPLRV